VFALQSYGKTSATVSPPWPVYEANVRARALLAEPCASPAAEPWHYVVGPSFLPTTYVPSWDRLPIQPTELPPFQSALDRCIALLVQQRCLHLYGTHGPTAHALLSLRPPHCMPCVCG
jgi:hypothetical protein